MATIGTSIRLTDMMSAPLRQINSAMDGLLYRCESLDSATHDGFDQMVRGQKNFNNEIQEGSNAMDGLTGKILGAVGAFVGLQSIQKLVNLSDSYTQTMARLNMIVDEGSSADELFDKIAASADRARASIATTADTVAKLSLNAGDAFNSNDETILFAENLNKLFAIAGTEQASIASASLQLTQALGSGVLRGEEFNAVFEAAPNIMQTVADYMNVPIGQLRSMAQEGQITAEIVKNALLSATGEINTQFESMPMTWAQVWTGIMNGLYYASVPLLNVINWLANNWSIISPIALGVAAALAVYLVAVNGVRWATTAWATAQKILNSVMALNPVVKIIMAVILFISVIYAVIAAINKVKGTTISATGVITGVIYSLFAFLWNIVASFINFFANVWLDPIGSIVKLFADLADTVLGLLEVIASGIDAVFGSNLAGAVAGWRSDLATKVEAEIGDSDMVDVRIADGMEAFNTGYDFGAGLEDSVGEFFTGGFDGLGDDYSLENLMSGIGDIPAVDDIGDIATNTGDIKDSLEITSEDLKYLRDIAEQETINRFTTAEIRVEMGGVNNTVNHNTDLDGVIDYMVTGVQEAMERVAEGVHN